MLKSIWLYSRMLVTNLFLWLSIVLFFLSAYDIFIKPLLPVKYQMETNIPTFILYIFAIGCLFIAGATAYHKLRIARLEELYKYLPEANKDKIFRIFYELYKEGCFLKNANTDRRQRWDVDVLKEIKNYCHVEFEHIYLLNTGRRNYEFVPLDDLNYDTALSHLKSFIDRDFNQFVNA